MDTALIVTLLVVAILLAVAAGAAGFVVAERRRRHAEATSAAERDAERELTTAAVQAAVDAAVARAVADTRDMAVSERDAAVSAALAQAATMNREQLDTAAQHVRAQTTAELSSKKDVIDARLDQVHDELRSELAKVTEMLGTLNQTNARAFGEVGNSLAAHAEITKTLSESTQSLRAALANPQARGQWGERMAEDVLRLAGFVENVNYVKQTQIEGGTGRPDYTFPMPKGHQLYMDVKFPMAAYLRYLEAGSDAEREAHLKRFLTDVRARVRELAKRDYANESSAAAVDYVLLFLPNEQLTGFIHEHDPSLLDDAMGQQVVMCSPLTLFAFLGVIRQAFDNFMIEQTSDEILKLIGAFGTQWRKYVDKVDQVQKRFASVDKAFDELAGTRRRALERPLVQLEEIRLSRGLAADGELFAFDGGDDETPPGGQLRQIGA